MTTLHLVITCKSCDCDNCRNSSLLLTSAKL